MDLIDGRREVRMISIFEPCETERGYLTEKVYVLLTREGAMPVTLAVCEQEAASGIGD